MSFPLVYKMFQIHSGEGLKFKTSDLESFTVVNLPYVVLDIFMTDLMKCVISPLWRPGDFKCIDFPLVGKRINAFLDFNSAAG